MRKITRDAVDAFRCGDNFDRDNTEVVVTDRSVGLWLHRNRIAERSFVDGSMFTKLNDCGWQTMTTKERLNGVLRTFNTRYYLYQSKSVWYLSTDLGIFEWKGAAMFKDGELLYTEENN